MSSRLVTCRALIGDGRELNAKGLCKRCSVVLTGTLVASAITLTPATAAADDPCLPENGCIPGEVAPPVPPDQAGNPQGVTVDWTQIPDVPVSVTVSLGLPAPPPHKTCKKKRKHAAASKKCQSRKRR